MSHNYSASNHLPANTPQKAVDYSPHVSIQVIQKSLILQGLLCLLLQFALLLLSGESLLIAIQPFVLLFKFKARHQC